MSTIDTATRERLAFIADRTDRGARSLDAEVVAERNGQIARLVHAGADKNELAELVGMGVPQINRIARTTPDGPAPEVVTGGSTVVVDDTIVAQTRKVDLNAAASEAAKSVRQAVKAHRDAAAKDKAASKAPAAGPRKVFQPAPAGGHVPPRARKVRSTGSVVSFGHASEMGYPKTPVEAHVWVSRCDTHSTADAVVDATFETRSEARYQDGTGYCLECASAANA